VRVAAAAWKLRPCSSWGDFEAHFKELIAQAADRGADLIVLPEFHSFELLGMHSEVPEPHIAGALAQYASAIVDLTSFAADWFQLAIVGGSHISLSPDFVPGSSNKGPFLNVCCVATADGSTVLCPKVKLTQYECSTLRLVGGCCLPELPDPRVGVTICYDCEFPEAGRFLAERGVLVHCVPAFTETARGFQRVRWSGLARAVENQLFVIHASLVGTLDREPVPCTYGSSAVLSPSIEPFPESSVLGETRSGDEGLAVADLDFGALAHCRANGDVRNWHDRDPGVWNSG
jgi:predicted amidohydrolase